MMTDYDDRIEPILLVIYPSLTCFEPHSHRFECFLFSLLQVSVTNFHSVALHGSSHPCPCVLQESATYAS